MLVAAKPEQIAIDTEKTALIVVDMQNDFGAKGGMTPLRNAPTGTGLVRPYG